MSVSIWVRRRPCALSFISYNDLFVEVVRTSAYFLDDALFIEDLVELIDEFVFHVAEEALDLILCGITEYVLYRHESPHCVAGVQQ